MYYKKGAKVDYSVTCDLAKRSAAAQAIRIGFKLISFSKFRNRVAITLSMSSAEHSLSLVPIQKMGCEQAYFALRTGKPATTRPTC